MVAIESVRFGELIDAALALVPPDLCRCHKKPSLTIIEGGRADKKKPRITLARPFSASQAGDIGGWVSPRAIAPPTQFNVVSSLNQTSR